MSARLLYDIPAAADQLSISPRVLARLIKDGEVNTVTIGRRRLVPAEALADYIERIKRAS